MVGIECNLAVKITFMFLGGRDQFFLSLPEIYTFSVRHMVKHANF